MPTDPPENKHLTAPKAPALVSPDVALNGQPAAEPPKSWYADAACTEAICAMRVKGLGFLVMQTRNGEAGIFLLTENEVAAGQLHSDAQKP